MLKRLIELIILAAVIYSGWHAGIAYLHYYQFKDAINEAALFAGRSSEAQLKQRVLQLAEKYEIPVDEAAVTVHIDDESTQISAPYTQPVKLLPNYIYEWKVEPTVDVMRIR